MNLLSILVVASIIGGVCSEVAVSFVIGNYTVQFNETSFRRFWDCLCTTSFECELFLDNQANTFTLNRIEAHNGSAPLPFRDAFHCTPPEKTSVVCSRVFVANTEAVYNPEQCQTFTYGNSSSGGNCFPKGLALFWYYEKYTVNTFSPAVENKSNCPEVVAAASATSAPVVNTASVGATTPSSVSIQPTYTPATTRYATTIQSSDAGGAATASNTNSDTLSESISVSRVTGYESLMSIESSLNPSGASTSPLTLESFKPTATPEQTPSPTALPTDPLHTDTTTHLPDTTLLITAPWTLTPELSPAAQTGETTATTNTASLGVSLDVVTSFVALPSSQPSTIALSALSTLDSHQSYSTPLTMTTAVNGAVTLTQDSGGIIPSSSTGYSNINTETHISNTISPSPSYIQPSPSDSVPGSMHPSTAIYISNTIPGTTVTPEVMTSFGTNNIQTSQSVYNSNIDPGLSQTSTITASLGSNIIQSTLLVTNTNIDPGLSQTSGMTTSLGSNIIQSTLPVTNTNIDPGITHTSGMTTSLGSNIIQSTLPVTNTNIDPGITQTSGMTTSLGSNIIQSTLPVTNTNIDPGITQTSGMTTSLGSNIIQSTLPVTNTNIDPGMTGITQTSGMTTSLGSNIIQSTLPVTNTNIDPGITQTSGMTTSLGSNIIQSTLPVTNTNIDPGMTGITQTSGLTTSLGSNIIQSTLPVTNTNVDPGITQTSGMTTSLGSNIIQSTLPVTNTNIDPGITQTSGMTTSLGSNIIQSTLPVTNTNIDPGITQTSGMTTSLGSNIIQSTLPVTNTNIDPGITQTSGMTTSLGSNIIQSTLPVTNTNIDPGITQTSGMTTSLGSNIIQSTLPVTNTNIDPGITQTSGMTTSLGSNIIQSTLPVTNTNIDPGITQTSGMTTSLGSNIIQSTLPVTNTNIDPGITQTSGIPPIIGTLDTTQVTTKTDISNTHVFSPGTEQGTHTNTGTFDVTPTLSNADVSQIQTSPGSTLPSSVGVSDSSMLTTLLTAATLTISNSVTASVSPTSPTSTDQSNVILSTGISTIDQTASGLTSEQSTTAPLFMESTQISTDTSGNFVSATVSTGSGQVSWPTSLSSVASVVSPSISWTPSVTTTSLAVSTTLPEASLSTATVTPSVSTTSLATSVSNTLAAASVSNTPSTAYVTTTPIIPSESFTPSTASTSTPSLAPTVSSTSLPPTVSATSSAPTVSATSLAPTVSSTSLAPSVSTPTSSNVTIPPPAGTSRQQDDRDRIIAITVGVIAGALFIFAILIAIYCWRRRKQDRTYQTMDGYSTSSDQPSDTTETPASKSDKEVIFDGIIPRFPNYKEHSGWDTFRPPYFTMIDIGPAGHNIIKGSVINHQDVTLADKRSSFKHKKGSSFKSVQFVNPLVEELEPDYMTTVSSSGIPKKGIIVKSVKFKNTTTESDDFEDGDDLQPGEEVNQPNNGHAYGISNAINADVPVSPKDTVQNKTVLHNTYESNGTVPIHSFDNHADGQRMQEESTHF